MASTAWRGRVHIMCKSCDMALWSAPVVIEMVSSSGTTVTGPLEELDSTLFGNARAVIDDHRFRHILRDGIGPVIDVQYLSDDAHSG